MSETSANIPKEVIIAPNERVLMVLERHYVSYVTIATIGLIIIWFITAGLSLAAPLEYGWVVFPIQVFVFLFLPVLVYGLGYVYVKGHRYVITNERIIMFRKFIGILMRTVTHDKITDIIVNQGPIGRLVNYGRVSPITAGMIMPMGAAIFSISGVKNPYEVRDAIAKLVKEFKPKGAEG
ncbi:MAG: PH domain-containing protein [Candidatus Bathyarchaeota archaeon]|nr:PH domain-containing protein [Candidatus Bathyarchaeota archaeon A05DMB-3]MDH7607267.1 PH domain-containing protein [Candidatus Bathyarchaeota archaeon]